MTIMTDIFDFECIQMDIEDQLPLIYKSCIKTIYLFKIYTAFSYGETIMILLNINASLPCCYRVNPNIYTLNVMHIKDICIHVQIHHI